MQTAFLPYLLQASGCLAVLYLLYRLLLHRETFFAFNRAFILAALGLSLGLPLFEIPVLPAVQPVGAPGNTGEMAQMHTPAAVLPDPSATKAVEQPARAMRWQTAALFIYLAVALALLVRLGCRLFSLYVLIRNAQAEERDGYAVIGTGGRLPTCSFFRWLFWNDRQTLTEGEQAQVLRHELTHIRQWHSLDLLLAEGVVVLLWFNPFAYWFRQQLQTLHEHLADREAARLYSQSAYLELLVSQALPPVKFSLVHPFGQSLLHTRVAMVRKGSHHRPARWKMTVSVAGVVLTSLAYACTEQKNVAPDGPGLLRTLAEADAQMVVFKQKYPRLRLGGFVETRYQDGRRVTAFGVTVEGVANATDQAKIKSLVAQQTAAVLESGRMEGDTAPYVLVDKPLPNVTVTGTVYAEDDHVPLAGCVAGSVVTGKNGRFQTNFRSGDTLTFTRVGYYTHKIPVRGQDGEQIRLSVRLRRNPTVAPERLARAEAAIAAEVARE